MMLWWKLRTLTKQLNDRSALVREKAARDLGEIEHAGAIKLLLSAIKDSNSNVRLAAVESLTRLPAGDAVAPLLDALDSGDDRAAIEDPILRALERIGSPAVPPMSAKLADETYSGRAELAGVLGRIGDPQAISVLVAATQDADASLRTAAI